MSQLENVLMFGLEGTGKTHFMYRGLISEGCQLPSIQPTIGFNCETVVDSRDSFNLWDVSGQKELLEIWPLYYHNIATKLVVFLVRANSNYEQLMEAKYTLHELL